MSIIRCPYCDNEYDADMNCEHEEICQEDGDTVEISSPQSDEVQIVDKKTYLENL